jgi:hypothetical protein
MIPRKDTIDILTPSPKATFNYSGLTLMFGMTPFLSKEAGHPFLLAFS